MAIISEEKSNKELIKKIQKRRLRVAVLGSGYVGLPTATLFAETGFKVIAIDLKREAVKAVNSGLSPVNEPGLGELVKQNVEAGRLRATQNTAEALSQAESVIISVQTPIDQKRKPNLSFLTKAIIEVGKTLKKEMLVVVSSTVPPGIMLGKVEPTLISISGLKADIDFYLAYVPERVSPGKVLKEFVESPRLVGGIGPNSTKIAAELLRTVCKKVIETDVTTAEVSKLAENTFRDVNIAFANQLALICEQAGVDVTEAIKLANTHPRVNIHTPGPGVGGPCLPKDPYLLTHQSKPLDHDMIKTARKINDNMPKHITQLTLQALKNTKKQIKNSKIAILGTAYKANVDDPRGSCSEPIIKQLKTTGAELITYDPHCKESFGSKKATFLHEAVKDADCLIIVTDHTEFKNINFTEIKQKMRPNPAIIDGKRIINPQEAEKHGFTYYGVGYGKPKNH